MRLVTESSSGGVGLVLAAERNRAKQIMRRQSDSLLLTAQSESDDQTGALLPARVRCEIELGEWPPFGPQRVQHLVCLTPDIHRLVGSGNRSREFGLAKRGERLPSP
jgi:hypothetical protein